MSEALDERIIATRQRWATHGFGLLFLALPADVMVRMFVLKQHPREWLDIFLLWMVTIVYVAIGTTASGVAPFGGRYWKMWPLIPLIVVVNTVTLARIGMVPTPIPVVLSVVGATVGLLVTIVVCRGLYRMWERRALGRGSREE